jgi:hypothetical protein
MFELAVAMVAQGSDDVIITVTCSPLSRVDVVKMLLFVPTGILFILHE